jgi:hypothetical protein
MLLELPLPALDVRSSRAWLLSARDRTVMADAIRFAAGPGRAAPCAPSLRLTASRAARIASLRAPGFLLAHGPSGSVAP